MLKIGDTVIWRGAWGKDLPKEAVITSIEVNCINGNGTNVNEVPWDKVVDRSVVVDLDNGHWSYGFQLEQMEQIEVDKSVFHYDGKEIILN